MNTLSLIKSEFKQIIFVCVAFAIMAFVSIFYVSTVMKRHIDLYSQTVMQVYHSALKSVILSHENALNHVATTIKMALNNGDSPEKLLNILTTFTDVYRQQSDIENVFLSVYGYLDGNFLDGAGLKLDEFYNVKTTPWLRGAILQNGVYHTKPYIDKRTNQVVAAISTVIYDNKGESRGVLGIDYLLNPIIKLVSDYRLDGTGYGIMIDSGMNVLSHPLIKYNSQPLDSIPEYAGLSDKLINIESSPLITEIKEKNVTNIAFFSKLENGWYLGVIAPDRVYYGAIYSMAPTIILIGLALAAPLCILLLGHAAEKYRSREESRLKSSFLAKMSHEIRTPMNAVIGMSDLAIRDYGKREGLNHLFEIKQAGKNLIDIINDILDISKIESSSFQLSNTNYKFSNIINDVLNIIKERAREKGLVFNYNIDSDIPQFMYGDEVAIRQILLNLLSNAIKYTQHGEVSLKIETIIDDIVHLDRIKIIFIVKDTGIGITNENMGNLFNDYVRIQQKNDKYIEGTGLGLSIVRNFCKMMGGSVYVESEYGKGSTFTATIMQQISDDSSLILDTDIISQKSELDTFNVKFTVPNWKMLVVDDNLTNLMVAKGYIEPYEIQITTVQTGDEALKLAKNQYFDIFLIDHMMPGMDGITLMKYLRDLEKITQPMVIIAFTANAIVGVKEMLLQEGFDDYLSKPIDSQKLAAIIEKYSPQDLRIQIKNSETIMNLPNKDTLDEININGIDSIIGLKRCNSNKKIYKRALQIFLDEAIETNKKLLNLENYGITEIKNIYHSIKSAAANIGAVSVSDLAANLENKCNQGTFSHTDHIISDFQTQFSNIINNIQDYYNLSAISGECKAESDNNLDKNLIFDLLDKLSVAISSNDFGSIDNIIETIESHNTGKLTSNINKIEQFILTAEFENALDIISSIKSEG